METLTGFVDEGRAVLAMEGTAARPVLQDVVTNDVAGIDRGAVYAALLTPQGKYLFDFFLVAEGERVLIDVAAARAEALAMRLKMYCIRRDARVVGPAGLGVALAWGQEAPAGAGAEALVLPDPRDAALGWRLYAADPAAALAATGAAAGDRAAYDALRVAHGVPETGVELVPGETFVLEAGLDRLHGVDFRKGCYVGQEVTARMRHKTDLKKRLVRVQVEGAAPPGTAVLTAEGKPAGTLFSQAGGTGLAHLRLDRATGPLTAGEARIAPL